MDHYVEVAVYRLKPEVTTEQFMQAGAAIQADFQKVDGFLHRDLFKCEDGRWLDLVYYSSRQAAEDAEAELTSAPNIQNIMAMLDIEADNFFHVTPVLAANSDAVAACHRLEQFYRDIGAGDLEKAMDLFLEDAAIFGPGEAPIVGKPAIRAWWQASLEQVEVKVTTEFEEAVAVGNAIILRGKTLGTLVAKTGAAAVPVNLWFMQIYRPRADGTLCFWRGSYGPNPDTSA